MERVVIPKYIFGNNHFENLNIFLDDQGKLILLPFLWSLHLSHTGSVFTWIKSSGFSKYRTNKYPESKQVLDNHYVSDNTIRNYLGHIFKLLRFINSENLEAEKLSVHQTELLTSSFLNKYINVELPKSLNSINSLNAHQAAINSFLAFLFELEIKDVTPITIYRKTRQLMSEADTRLKKINYVSKSERTTLLRECNNQRDRIILRLGFEVGLRTSELCGLLIRKKNERSNSSRKGLLNLFFELENAPSKMSFVYLLEGKYTKRGKSRNIYFSRELLQSMKDYFDNERLIVEKQSRHITDSFFLRIDAEGLGRPICIEQGSNTFRELKKLLPFINETLSYHDLRHTFATELYHQELLDSDGNETRSESAALLSVSQRLGHADPKTSRIYIRLRQQMMIMENEFVEY